jgi:hypothetical protein
MNYKNPINESVSLNHLPQMEADIEYVKEELTKNGIQFEEIQIEPKALKPIQKTVYENKVSNFNEMIDNNEPISAPFISLENEILDGHHRSFAFMQHPEMESKDAFKVLLPTNDAIRILNKIQDRHNWENELASGEDKILSFTDNIDEMGDSLPPSPEEGTEEAMYFDDVQRNCITLKLYKNTGKVNTKSKTGDFLLLVQKPSFNNEFEIEFENLLDLSFDEIAGHNIPAEALAEKWFPNVDLKKEAVKSALTYEVFLNRKISEKAKQEGIDGIKYGDKFVQVIN